MRTLISALAGLGMTLPGTVTIAPISLPSFSVPAVIAAAPAIAVLMTPDRAEAQRRGGRGHRGGGHRAGGRASRGGSHRAAVRSGGRHSVNRNVHRSSRRYADRGYRGDRGRYHHGHYSRRDVYHHYDHGYRRYYNGRGYGAGLAVGAATSLAVGAVVASLPASCTGVTVNSVYYHRCGSAWYAPQYSGADVNYVVVNDPR